MMFEYRNLRFDDLRGELVADYLVAVDADLAITDGGVVVYEEPSFPVVELARALAGWVDAPGRGDFLFESLSSDVVGLVTIARERGGWSVCSATDPDRRSAPVTDDDVTTAVRGFVDRVRSDLRARGVDADHVLALGPTPRGRPA